MSAKTKNILGEDAIDWVLAVCDLSEVVVSYGTFMPRQ